MTDLARAFLAPQTEAGADDRITCAQCRNLRGRECSAWREVQAIRGYAPDPELPRRCLGYRPGREDEDQRTGAQRFRNLECVITEETKHVRK